MHRQNPLRSALVIGLVSLIAACAPLDRGGDNALITALAGRTPGAVQTCVPNRQGESIRAVDGDTLIYGSGRTIWVNELGANCPGLDRMDAVIVEPATGTQYCRGDRIRPFEPATGAAGPFCILGDFIPYTR